MRWEQGGCWVPSVFIKFHNWQNGHDLGFVYAFWLEKVYLKCSKHFCKWHWDFETAFIDYKQMFTQKVQNIQLHVLEGGCLAVKTVMEICSRNLPFLSVISILRVLWTSTNAPSLSPECCSCLWRSSAGKELSSWMLEWYDLLDA